MIVTMPPQPPSVMGPKLPGAEDLWRLMQAIHEKPEETKAFLREWAKIMKSADAFAAAMVKYTKATNLEAAEKAIASAEEEIAGKRQEADQIIEIARADADDIKAEARQKAAENARKLNARETSLNEREAGIDKVKASAQADRETAAKVLAQAQHEMELADADRKAAAAKLAKVHETLSGLEAA